MKSAHKEGEQFFKLGTSEEDFTTQFHASYGYTPYFNTTEFTSVSNTNGNASNVQTVPHLVANYPNDDAKSVSSILDLSHRQYKLAPCTPQFMSNGLTCEDWFFVFECALDNASKPTDMILPVLSSYLTGTALQLLITFMRDYPYSKNSWTRFKQIR